MDKSQYIVPLFYGKVMIPITMQKWLLWKTFCMDDEHKLFSYPNPILKIDSNSLGQMWCKVTYILLYMSVNETFK